MDKKNLVSFLRKAIRMEYGDVFLYNKEKLDSQLSEKIKGIFEAFGNQEIAHLDIFSMELKKITDNPTVELVLPPVTNTLKESLYYHKGQEETTISFYEGFAEMLDEKDEGELKRKLNQIITDEKTHLDIINKLIKEIK